MAKINYREYLRGGKIARGGIRWSDRDDYRVEVLGLMKAQMTKNSIIVPDELFIFFVIFMFPL